MQIHETPFITLNLPGIQKASGKAHTKANISRTATPFPCLNRKQNEMPNKVLFIVLDNRYN